MWSIAINQLIPLSACGAVHSEELESQPPFELQKIQFMRMD